MHQLLTVLEQLPPSLMYVAAALVVGAETALVVGLLLPGEATLLLVGFLIYLGTLRPVPALATVLAAAVIGDALAFRSGRRYGPRIRASRLGDRVGERRWRAAESMLHRSGGRGVFVARWVAFARTLVPRLAGAAGMPYRRFVVWDFFGVLTWGCASVGVGFLAGESYERVSDILGRATGAVFAMLGCVIAIVLVGRWLGRNPDPARALLARAGALPVLRWLRRRFGGAFVRLSDRVGPGWALMINMIAGLGLMFIGGLALGWLVQAVVTYSRLSAVDEVIGRWAADRRTSDVDAAAELILSVARGSLLIVTVALVAAALAWRARLSRAWMGQRDLVGLVGTAGAFLPLIVLAQAADRLLPEGVSGAESGRGFLPAQATIVTASLCTLAWLVGRHVRWLWAVAAWTCAAVGILVVVGARIYLGWSYASEAVTSVLLGVLWTVIFMIAWATRGQGMGNGDRTPTPPPDADAEV